MSGGSPRDFVHPAWMDTEFTERQGYPVEIQALWFNALNRITELTEFSSRENTKAQEAREKAKRLAKAREEEVEAAVAKIGSQSLPSH